MDRRFPDDVLRFAPSERQVARVGMACAVRPAKLRPVIARVSEQLTMRVNGLNIGNERYVDRVGGGHFIPGPGRSVMLTADIGF